MARGVNKVILVGNLGQDPEIRYTASGSPVATLSIATSDTWKDKNTGQQQERTEWHRVVLWNRLAEIVSEYAIKGTKIYIEGSLQTRKWDDAQGVTRYSTEIVAGEMQLLGGARERSDAQPRPPARPETSSTPGYGASQPARYAPPQPTAQPSPPMDSFDDDIPF